MSETVSDQVFQESTSMKNRFSPKNERETLRNGFNDTHTIKSNHFIISAFVHGFFGSSEQLCNHLKGSTSEGKHSILSAIQWHICLTSVVSVKKILNTVPMRRPADNQ